MKSTTNMINTLHADAIVALVGQGLIAEDSEMEKNIGRKVRFCNWEPSMGTLTRDYDFTIVGVQKIYNGTIAYRVICNNGHDTFGRAARPDAIRFV